ncbi:MAG: hypothetical protein ETSY2_15020, partial [Candidatus Entotheonella gemina]
MTDNPLLQLTSLPDFGTIHSEHIVPAIRQLLDETDAERQQLEAGLEPTWAGVMQPLEQLENRLSLAWGAVGHLMGVKNGEALRQAHQEVQGEVVQFWMRLGQSQSIYQGLKALKASAQWPQLDAAQQRIVDSSIQDAELSGVGLEGEPRARFNAIQQELAELSTTFSNHLLDATKAFYLDLHQPEEIEGLPPSLLQMAAQAAREAGHDQATIEQGPWRMTLDFPSATPFLEHSRRRDLREQVYRALITRASEGELDNTPLISRILELRREQASILGYANYAELSLASKMAPDVQTVEALLEQLRQASFDTAQQDLAELRDFARSQGAAEADDLQHWDIAFWAERLREHRYSISDEELRPYFPLPKVLDGLFALVQRLFGVTIQPADGSVPVWHPDVRFFRIYDANDKEIAAFYLDAYSRPAEKRGGAWMDGCVGRSQLLAAP